MQKWKIPIGPGDATPALRGERLYLSIREGDEEASLCIDARDRGGFGAIVDLGPPLVALPSSGELVVFKPGGEGYEELAKYQVSDAAVYGHPVLAGNRIFVKDDSHLTLWTVN
ncbi:MAG: hypothetical protein PHO07_13715 [Pirellulales bacterium]|nr:hypothetical protein [Thermoguttaceae bacterium]MDD4788226.1 hypothetical protein [Pirellulales bacterium]MDI9444416.1 hypothetical protein [Planctomycetota bacterium]NLZ01766.1 hypothetical protein [Pirellulaceae bacterium]